MSCRFYETVSIGATAGGFGIELDGRDLKTPAKNPLVLPTEALADLVAAEWHAQGDGIDSFSMPHMRLASTAIDRVAQAVQETGDSFAAYGMSDLLCYRAPVPDKLVAHQALHWDPLLDWVRHRFDMSFEVTSGILPVAQPPTNRARLAAIAGCEVFRLTGLAHLAAILGSAILALALEDGHIDDRQAHRLAFLDDLYQIDEWGADEEAQRRLTKIALDIRATSVYLSALR